MKHAARRHGVIDPATLLAKLRSFAQPSEVAEPIELMRAGIVFHARGLVNAKAIQHNLDWVWPYWVERQFNPSDISFIPRAFSFSHINLTHRNWTAVGLPDLDAYPIVDPRGLVTPLYNGWSLDFWIVADSGRRMLPSKLGDESVSQALDLEPTLAVMTRCCAGDLQLEHRTSVVPDQMGSAEVRIESRAIANEDGWFTVAVRPYNPEGVQFIHRIEQLPAANELRVNDEATVRFGQPPESIRMAHYAEGDVYLEIAGTPRREVSCEVGMATAAAVFRMRAGEPLALETTVSLERDLKHSPKLKGSRVTWSDAIQCVARLQIDHPRMQFLYDAAIRTLLLLSADELVPGPYTYRRFWFRDACLMLHALLVTGLTARSARIIATFPAKQTKAGYFLSQDGEWDSNGQVLWIMARHAELCGDRLVPEWEESLRKGMAWLAKKRLGPEFPQETRGLLPAGFSAEHLGPNDFYYWDDFWAWAGLQAVSRYWKMNGAAAEEVEASKLAAAFASSISASIESIPSARANGAIPAAPGRRMDAGAIGSMVADYPLQLYPPGHPPVMRTAGFLMDRCFSNGGFFQEMIHSGINAYLTLDLAQTLLRAGDDRYMPLMRRVAELASPTGQWPEAIHPQTLGGCMGDGQHGWAAAEWIMMVRNCFVREEDDRLVIGSGILPEWQGGGRSVKFGPTPTRWGTVTIALDGGALTIDAKWRGACPRVEIRVPGFVPVDSGSVDRTFHLRKL